MVFPVLGGSVRWHRTFGSDFGTHRHTGEDLVAPKMTPVVAPFAGTIGMKINSFWIDRSDGLRCLATHLNDDTPGTGDGTAQPDFMFAPDLRPGDRVWPGRLIGYVGDSGWASGPHLHFELHEPRGLIDPAASLKAAFRIPLPVPAPMERKDLPRPGEVRLDGVRRGYDAKTRTLTLLLTSSRHYGRPARVPLTPRWVRIRLTGEAVRAAEGEDGLRSLPRDRTITVWCRPSGSEFGYVRRMVLRRDE